MGRIIEMRIKLVQTGISQDIEENTNLMAKILMDASNDEWVVFPEGMLSGYYPEDPNFVALLDAQKINQALQQLRKIITQRQCICIFGTAYFDAGKWYNAVFALGGKDKEFTYYKNNLAFYDQHHFVPGNHLPVFEINGVRFGIQACREIIFPEQWKVLKRKGAQIVFHINNAIKVKDRIWSNLLITRAFENQYFVCSANNSAFPQTLSSYVISPFGDILYESQPQNFEIGITDIDLNTVETYYLKQERRDLVNLYYKES